MTTNGRPLSRGEELACDAALFGLDDADRAELLALDADAEALLDLELAAGEVAARAHEAHPETVPAALAEKLLAQAAAEPPSKVDAKVIPLAPRRPHGTPGATRAPTPAPRRPSPLPWLLAAAAIVLALFGWLRRDTAPVAVPGPAPSASAERPETPASAREALLGIAGTSRVPWKATADPSATGAAGDVVWHGGAQRGFMRFTGLAPNDPAKVQYQLWIFDGERDDRFPVDGGVFNVGPEGEIVVPIEAKLHVSKPTLFAITVEKPGGVVVSKRERIVLTASPPPT